MSDGPQGTLLIAAEGDILSARKIARESCAQLGFGLTDTTRIVTAVSELARNVYHYATTGTMRWHTIGSDGKTGLELVFSDEGPGIEDIEQAMQVGFSTNAKSSLGMGLPGVKRLMDEMEIQSQLGAGTTVIIRKWLALARR